MSSNTANKVVAFFAFGGIILALWTGKNGADRYRKVWGVTLLSIGGAALADFVPGLVGPYFGLIIIAYAAANYGKISTVAKGIQSQATGTRRQ